MKILHLLQSNSFSGAENVVCQIISMMRDESNIEMVYCSPDGQIREALEERSIRFIPLKRFSVSEIKIVLKKELPDIIHAHDIRASFYAARVCGGITLISHIHNNNFDSRRVSIKSIAYLYAAVKAKHIFWVSNSSYTGYYFHSLFKRKSSVLYNIININGLYNTMHKDINEYNYDVVYLGRLTYQKNPERLMKVIKLLIKKKRNVKIAIIGTGELEEATKKLTIQLGIEDNIDFLGYRNNPYKILHDAKLMIMTSRWEGTPMCVLEAMALGVPVVSTPVDGIKDIIHSGENGFLCEEDEYLAGKMFDIITDKSLRNKLSERALKDAERINDIQTYKLSMLNIYRSNDINLLNCS